MFDLYGIIKKISRMKKRIEPTLVEKAIQAVPGFEQVFNKPGQQVILRGQRKHSEQLYPVHC
jgi:hypothetical protein